MKILFTCLSKSWGGMEMLTLTQIQQLLNRQLQVELLCIPDSRIHIEAKEKGLKVHTLKSLGYFDPPGISFLISFLKENNIEIIHSHASKDLWTVVPALKLSRNQIPLILTKHVGSYVIKKDFMHRWIYKRVSFALAISEMIQKNLIETTPLSNEKILLIHNGVDINKFNPENAERNKTRYEFSFNKDDIVIGMMGRFSPGKGHEEFLKAAKTLNKKNSNLKFIIVGEASFGEEFYEKEIKVLSEKLELKNVIFAGFRSDSVNVLSAMDIFIFPSHAESFGLALAEAMAMELPSVSSNSNGILDITVDEQTGFLFENKNPESLAEKTVELITSDKLRKKIGKDARKRIIEYFNIEDQTKKLIEIYSSLIPTN